MPLRAVCTCCYRTSYRNLRIGRICKIITRFFKIARQIACGKQRYGRALPYGNCRNVFVVAFAVAVFVIIQTEKRFPLSIQCRSNGIPACKPFFYECAERFRIRRTSGRRHAKSASVGNCVPRYEIITDSFKNIRRQCRIFHKFEFTVRHNRFGICAVIVLVIFDFIGKGASQGDFYTVKSLFVIFT